MCNPQVSIIIPTHNRPHLVPEAVKSALAQTFQDLEVIVVDDASREVLELPPDPRLRVIRLEKSRGGAGARNVGTEAAKGRWVTYLDDDDLLLPHMVEVSLNAIKLPTHSEIALSSADSPVAVISGLEKITVQGESLKVRRPPSLSPKGSYFFLEEPEVGSSYATKQTLVVERSVVLEMGGWDESFPSRVHSEFFLRLNPVCTLIGIPIVTYQLRCHDGNRISGNPLLRQESFQRLIAKHRVAFESHPRQFAQFIYRHARNSWEQGQFQSALMAISWGFKVYPTHSSRVILQQLFRFRPT